MKRDMDLVRDLLLAVENAKSEIGSSELIGEADEEEADRIRNHLRLLQDAGMLTGITSTPLSAKWRAQNLKLTWSGYDFIATIQDPEVWRRTREGATKMGNWSVDLLKDMAKAYVKHIAKERLGLDL